MKHGTLAALAAIMAATGGGRFADSGGRAPREPVAVNEAERARKRDKRAARGKRRYERWLAGGGSETQGEGE